MGQQFEVEDNFSPEELNYQIDVLEKLPAISSLNDDASGDKGFLRIRMQRYVLIAYFIDGHDKKLGATIRVIFCEMDKDGKDSERDVGGLINTAQLKHAVLLLSENKSAAEYITSVAVELYEDEED